MAGRPLLTLFGVERQGWGEEEPWSSRDVEASSLPVFDPKTRDCVSSTRVEAAVSGTWHTVTNRVS